MKIDILVNIWEFDVELNSFATTNEIKFHCFLLFTVMHDHLTPYISENGDDDESGFRGNCSIQLQSATILCTLAQIGLTASSR